MQNKMAEFKQYLDRRYPGSSTTKHYMNDLAIFKQYIGETELVGISTKTIDKFVQAQSGQQLKAATINRRLSAISSFFDFLLCENEQAVMRNPVDWKRHSVRQGQHLARDVNDETVQALFSVIQEKRDEAMFRLMLNGGLRVGEVVDLRLDALQSQTPEGLTPLRVCGKGDKERMIWLTHETMRQVQAWLDERPVTSHNFLFLNQHKRQLSVAGVQHLLKEYCEKAGVHLSCHQLRHTFARRLAEEQMPIDSLAKLLGHSGVQTTQRYINGADPALRSDFLAAMRSVQSATTGNLLSQTLPFVQPSPPATPPSPKAILALVEHLGNDLPMWLQSVIQEHTLRRIPRWTAHRAKQNALNHFATLCTISRWLVAQRTWLQLELLRRQDLDAYVSSRQADGLQANSISAHLVIFRIFWRDLLDQELVTAGAILRVKAPKKGQPLPRYLTESEFLRLEQVVNEQTALATAKDILNRTCFYLLAHAGLRRSELLNLRVNDCDFTGKRLRIQAGKGNRDRTVPLSDTLLRLLHAYLAIRETAPSDHLLIFKHAPLTQQLVAYRLRQWGILAKIAPLTPHRLRHTLATLLLNRGMPIVSLQKFLGHQNINNTLIYAHVHNHTLEQQFSAAMASIEAITIPDWPTLPAPDFVSFIANTANSDSV